MPDILFVCLQDEDKIASFAIDVATGGLTRQADRAVAGGPSVLALSPDRRVLHVGRRAPAAISSFRIDQRTGALDPLGSVDTADAPTFLAPDRTGHYLLAAYYQGGYAAVHPLGADGSIGAPLLGRQDTGGRGARIATDPSNRSHLFRTSRACRTMFSNRRRISRAPISSRSSASTPEQAT